MNIIKRICSSVKFTETCWNWTGYKQNGYGYVRVGSKRRRVHRWVYQQVFNAELDDMFVCHKCDNPSCINPDHLYAGTHIDNMRDRRLRNRHFHSKKTHCKHGHEFDGDNLHINKNGHRCCKTCMKDYRLTHTF